MSKSIDHKINIDIDEAKSKIKLLRDELVSLKNAHHALFTGIQKGVKTTRSRVTVLGDRQMTIKQIREEIKARESLLKLERELLRNDSFDRAKKSYTDNYKRVMESEKALGRIKDKGSKEAMQLQLDIANSKKSLAAIEKRWGGYDGFADFKQGIESQARQKETLANVKRQAIEEENTHKRSNRNISRSITSKASTIKTQMGLIALAFRHGKINAEQYGKSMRKLEQDYRVLERAMEDVQKRTSQKGFKAFGSGIKSHLNWMISGRLVEQLYNIPNAIKDISVEFDNLERKIAQNIELTGEFEHQPEKLKKASRDLTTASLYLANKHGMKINETLEMMQIMSRRFKDPAELKYYTDLAMTLSKLDFVTPAVAAESLESVILSFNLNARETKDFVNEFSIATHTMRINGEDLLQALQRSAPMLKQWGIGTRDAVALISTLSTTLGREGKYIGNAMTGMFSRLLNKKNSNFFKEIGISMEKANGQAKTGMELLNEYLEHYKDLTHAARREEINNMFGTYRVVPAMSMMDTFNLLLETRDNIINKASDTTTEQLEKMQIESHESKINRFNNTIQFLAFCIGDVLAPTVTDVLEIITDLIMKLIEWDDGNGEVIGSIIAAISTLALYAVSISTINKLFGKHITLIGLSSVFTKDFAKHNNLLAKSVANLNGGFVALAGRLMGTIALLYVAYKLITKISELVSEGEAKRELFDYIESKGGVQNLDPKDPVDAKALEAYHAIKIYGKQKGRDEIGYIDPNVANHMTGYGKEGKFDNMRVFGSNEEAERYALTKVNEFGEIKATNEMIKGDTYLRTLMTDFALVQANLNKPLSEMPTGTKTGNTNKDSKELRAAKREQERRQKAILDAITSQFKTNAELSQKSYDSTIADIMFDQEIFGKTPQSILSLVNTKTDRRKEIKEQIKERDSFINNLRETISKNVGSLSSQFSSSIFDALKDEMDKTLGSTGKTSGEWINEMVGKIGFKLSGNNITDQIAQFKENGKFLTDTSKMSRGDIAYWTGLDSKGESDASHAGIYLGNGMIRYVGDKGVQDIDIKTIKGLVGYGSTGVNDFSVQDLERIGESNANAKITAEMLKKVNELKTANADDEAKIKEITRELKRSYLLSDKAKFKREKDYLKATEESALLDVTNKRNAFNKTVKINVQLDFAKKELDILERELDKAINDRKEIMSKLDDAMNKSTEGMTEAELEKHETLINIYKTQLQEFEIVEAQKVLAVKRAKQEIEDLEDQTTEKIREGLHGVVNDLLIQGKSLKDIWNNLWTDLAEEALRALMGIQDGQQSTLGAIAARAFGLDKATPEQKGIETQITATTTNTNSLDANTRAIQGLTTSFADSADEISKAALGASNTVKDTLSKGVYADSMDSISKDSMSAGVSSFASQGKGKSADSTMAALGILAAATSMSGSKKASKFASLLSIAIPFIGGDKAGGAGASTAAAGKGKGKKKAVSAAAYGGNSLGTLYGGHISHDGSIIGVTPLPTRYYHNGGNVGTSVVPYLKSDEVNAVLQTGEEVVSRKDRRSNELMSEQNKHMADAMQRMAEGSNTNVTFAIQAIDSKSVVQLLSENGDAIMNILRKQSAYGNGRI